MFNNKRSCESYLEDKKLTNKILSILCDDDETVDTIIAMLKDKYVYKNKVKKSLIYNTLFALYRNGYVRVFDMGLGLLEKGGKILPIDAINVDIEIIKNNKKDYWFHITPKGRELFENLETNKF